MKNYIPQYVYPLREDDGWKELTGDLPVRMTNDYLFRALLQSDNETLKELLTALLHKEPGEIVSANVMNPILLGESIDDKTFILDVKVDLDDKSIIDLEMQVIHEAYWTDRSLSYLCRSFDRLNQGDPYGAARPVLQIAFCDFTLFEDAPEFYSVYKIVNIRKPEIVYSEKFVFVNIDLTREDLATEEDRKYRIDVWAKLFKAETWEDLKMLAAKNEAIDRAVSGAWQLTEEEMIREKCRARDEWIINDKWKTDTIAQQEAALKEYEINDKWKTDTIAQQEATLKEYEINDKRKTDTIAQQSDTITQLRNEMGSERNRADKAEARIRELEAQLAAQEG